ncbi:MAG: hypothetical protein QNJ68_04825 [Microcoleaceae cyanobacterium MO_207.B10]|nr:hypothetical protein [Microcoleaceae cyanobacterium MO_207.B10]
MRNEFPDERTPHPMDLIALFGKYKPELLAENSREFERRSLSLNNHISQDLTTEITIPKKSDFVR